MKPSAEFYRFGIVGVLGFVVDAIMLTLLLKTGIFGLYSARLFSFLAAATTTWAVNRRYTFVEAGKGPLLSQWTSFLAVNSVGGIVNYLVYALSVANVSLITNYPVLGVALGSLAGWVFNFSGSKKWVFRDHSQNNNEREEKHE